MKRIYSKLRPIFEERTTAFHKIASGELILVTDDFILNILRLYAPDIKIYDLIRANLRLYSRTVRLFPPCGCIFLLLKKILFARLRSRDSNDARSSDGGQEVNSTAVGEGTLLEPVVCIRCNLLKVPYMLYYAVQ